jgi:hypothetical protein
MPARPSAKGGPLDVIDQIDATGSIFGTAAHHDSPFDAVSMYRNKSNNEQEAPMAAFGRSKSMREPARRAQGGATHGVSARAQAALAAMEDTKLETLDSSTDHLLMPSTPSSASSSTSSLLRVRRNSDSGNSVRSVHLGYPAPNFSNSGYLSAPVSKSQKQKAAQLAETFGIQDSEAWEDYGKSRYASSAPRESVYDTTAPPSRTGLSMTQEKRAQRTASVWDMEATLREGVPVASGERLRSQAFATTYVRTSSPTAYTYSSLSVPSGQTQISFSA